MPLRALARVNIAAIERNVAALRGRLSAGSRLCAVVKADGYGHGALAAGRAALAGGADALAVATAGEAEELRAAGIAGRVLVMGALSTEELGVAAHADADVVAWTEEFVTSVGAAARARRDRPIRVHVKLDTGMGRLGTRDPEEARRVANAVVGAGAGVELAGVMTHFATADDDAEFLAAQLERFDPFVREMRRRAPGIKAHAANSAATLREPASHYDFVRCGVAIYGLDPMNRDAADAGLEPALELTSYVAAVKPAQPGESTGYGRTFVANSPTCIATLPIGYGDGVRRALSNNCDVLIGGRRYPLVGTISMDNITVDLGPATAVVPGDRAVLVGRDGGVAQSAEELARRIGTINYEIVCGVSPRVPRVYHRDGEALP